MLRTRSPGEYGSSVGKDPRQLITLVAIDERSLFELLQTANGVGPRLAQAVLAIHPPREVRRAVSMVMSSQLLSAGM